MTRRTRPDTERFNAMTTFTRQGFASFTRSLIEVVIVAGIAGGLTRVVTDDPAQVAAGAGIAALAVLLLTLVIAAVILLALVLRGERGEADNDGDGWPFHDTSANSRNRYPDTWTRAQYLEYLTAVFDEDDDTGFNQRDAAAFGHERDKFNALVGWVHERGWYRYLNGLDNRNGGEWVAPAATILATPPDGDNG